MRYIYVIKKGVHSIVEILKEMRKEGSEQCPACVWYRQSLRERMMVPVTPNGQQRSPSQGEGLGMQCSKQLALPVYLRALGLLQ